MGSLKKWDLSKFLDKLSQYGYKTKAGLKNNIVDDTTFHLTIVSELKEKLKITKNDIILLK